MNLPDPGTRYLPRHINSLTVRLISTSILLKGIQGYWSTICRHSLWGLKVQNVKILKHRIWCVDELPEFKEFLIDCLYKMKVFTIKENQERIKDNINPGNLRNCYL